MGKIGSIIGQGAIAPLRTRGGTKLNPNPWMDHVLEIYALFMLLGVGSTALIKETKRKTLEELAEEDEEGDNYVADSSAAPVAAENTTEVTASGDEIAKH